MAGILRGPRVTTTHRAALRTLPRTPARIALAVVGLWLLLGWLPGFMESFAPFGVGLDSLNFALVAVMGTVALNLLVGYTGLLSMGHAAFLALGAFGGGLIGVTLGAPFWVVLVVSALLGAGVGVLVGLPALRLRGLYLLLSTLSLHFIGLYLFLQYQLDAFGPAGIQFEAPTFGPLTIDTDRRWYFLLIAGCAISILLVRNLLRTRNGRALIAVRDSDVAAGAAGVNVAATKLKVFAMSSAMVTVAGTLYAYYLGTAAHGNYTLALVEGYYAMLIVGGMGSLLGSVLGALLYTCLPPVLEQLSANVDPGTPVIGTLLVDNSDDVAQIVFGVLIIVVLITRPAGLASIWTSTKGAVKRWPF